MIVICNVGRAGTVVSKIRNGLTTTVLPKSYFILLGQRFCLGKRMVLSHDISWKDIYVVIVKRTTHGTNDVYSCNQTEVNNRTVFRFVWSPIYVENVLKRLHFARVYLTPPSFETERECLLDYLMRTNERSQMAPHPSAKYRIRHDGSTQNCPLFPDNPGIEGIHVFGNKRRRKQCRTRQQNNSD